MPFKIVSTVSINASPPGIEPVSHNVLTREKRLRLGEKIPINGSITYDIEAKGRWISARGEIRVIDDKTIGIRWRPSFGEGLFHGLVEAETMGIRSKVSEAKEFLRWNEERIIKVSGQKTNVDLGDSYSYANLSEVFNHLDRLRIKPLTEKAMKTIEGIKTIERETKLVYEP